MSINQRHQPTAEEQRDSPSTTHTIVPQLEIYTANSLTSMYFAINLFATL